MLSVEIVYAASASSVWRQQLQIAAGMTLSEVIQRSSLAHHHPELDLLNMGVAVFGRVKSGDHLVCDGDRIEVCRPLVTDPKDQRRERLIRRRAVQIEVE